MIQLGGLDDGVPVLYFHGAASRRDAGPSDLECKQAGVRLLRHVRPGYDHTDAAPDDDLGDVAAAALEEAAALDLGRLVVMGWSGGGPYALGAAALGRGNVAGVCLLGSWAPMTRPTPTCLPSAATPNIRHDVAISQSATAGRSPGPSPSIAQTIASHCSE